MMHSRNAVGRHAWRLTRASSVVTSTISTRCLASLATAVSSNDQKYNKGSSVTLAAGLVLLTAAAAAASERKDDNVTQCKAAAAAQNFLHSGVSARPSNNEDTTELLNWSGTHSVKIESTHLHEPDTIEQVESIVRYCHEHNTRLRPLGAALSPNGIAFNPKGMISMANLDEIVKIDPQNMTVTVQAGARVREVVQALRPYKMTLPNLASIAEQQMGGFVQIGAHGTGRTIAPVDHYVTSLTLVTPNHGKITLTENDGEIFHLAKVGLGLLGVVVELTMKCVPAHNLVERTTVLTRQEAKERLNELLLKHQHMRYMWIPYTDSVVCVTNDPEDKFVDDSRTNNTIDIINNNNNKNSNTVVGIDTTFNASNYKNSTNKYSHDERFHPFRELVLELYKHIPNSPYNTLKLIKDMGFGELRDAILSIDPLNLEHVKRCNQAEAEFWKRSQGYQVRPSDELLQFDCGSQQWVYEVCFPTAATTSNRGRFSGFNNKQINNNIVGPVSDGTDMKFMEQLLQGIEAQSIPAHAPIEQRWTASSSSLMSPAHGKDLQNGLHSWVGVIYYLPTVTSTGDNDGSKEQEQRNRISQAFKGQYCDLVREISPAVNATSHWAKLEMPQALWQLADMRSFLQSRYPLKEFNRARYKYDPKNILSNDMMDMVLGKPAP